MRLDARGLSAMLIGASLLLAPGCDPGEGEGPDDTELADDGGNKTESESLGCAGSPTASDCASALGCTPLFGSALREDASGGWCTSTTEQYIGCVSTLELCPNPDKVDCEELCPATEKILCGEDRYWQTFDCVPDDLTLCAAPGEITGECPGPL